MKTIQVNPKEKIFPYVSYRRKYYPVVPIIVEGRERIVVHALVDSGATISLFHTCIADDAGIDLEDAEQVYLAGIGGCTLKHMLRSMLRSERKASIEGLGRITIPIAFTEYIVSDIAILGRQGFFEAFEITFREWGAK